MIKTIYFRKLKQLVSKLGISYMCKKEISEFALGQIKYPSDLIKLFSTKYEELGKEIEETIKKMSFNIIVNKCDKSDSLTLGQQITLVCNRHFYKNFHFLGNVHYDTRVHQSILNRSIFVHRYPYTTTAVDLDKLTKNLLGLL